MSPYSECSYSSSEGAHSCPSSPGIPSSNPLMSTFISSNQPTYDESPYDTRSTDHPSALTLYLNLRGVSKSSGYAFDHDLDQNPPAREFKGEAYQAIDELSVTAYDTVQDWMTSEKNQYASSKNTFTVNQSTGEVTIASSAESGIEGEIRTLIEPSLQAYRDRTGMQKEDVNFEIRFNRKKEIGLWEQAFKDAPGTAGVLPSYVGTTGGEYDSDEELNNRSSQNKEHEEARSNARLLAWRASASASLSGGTGQENTTAWEPSETGHKLQVGELSGMNVPSEAGAEDPQHVE